MNVTPDIFRLSESVTVMKMRLELMVQSVSVMGEDVV